MDSDSNCLWVSLPPCISVQLHFGRPSSDESELIENIPDPHLTFTSSLKIRVQPILSFLKIVGFPLAGSLIYYYSPEKRHNVFCGSEPLAESVAVSKRELRNRTLTLICRDNSAPERWEIPSFAINSNASQETCHCKERKIGYIVERVNRWRQLYHGVANEEGESQRMNLETAATFVGISKKSLDDYLLQMRAGKKYGFNFQEHWNEKVGLLRAYVKKMKVLTGALDKAKKGEITDREVIEKLKEPGTPACKHTLCCYPEYASNFKSSD